jgi:hypothetical protein
MSNSLFAEQTATSITASEIKQTLKQVGKTRFSVLFWDVYDSELFTTSGKYDESLPILFEITYLRDIESKELIDNTVDQWQHLEYKKAEYQPFVEPLRKLWPDITEGDKLTLLVEENRSVFYFNDQEQGAIDNLQFGPMFIAIWLSPDTSEPKLRRALLGIKQ